MSGEELQNPQEGGGVQEEQEPTQQEKQEEEKIFLPIFVKKFDNYDVNYEIVEIALSNIIVKNMNVTLNGVIYKIEVNLNLKDIIDIFRNVNTKDDYIKALMKIDPYILQVNELIFTSEDNEDDP